MPARSSFWRLCPIRTLLAARLVLSCYPRERAAQRHSTAQSPVSIPTAHAPLFWQAAVPLLDRHADLGLLGVMRTVVGPVDAAASLAENAEGSREWSVAFTL